MTVDYDNSILLLQNRDRDHLVVAASTTALLEAAAYHEAGHAFMAISEKLPFHYVTVADSEASLADVLSIVQPAMANNLHVALDEVAAKRTDSFVKVTLAGIAAEQMFTGRREQSRARADFRAAANLARVLYPNPILRMRYLKSVVSQLGELLTPVEDWNQSPWNQISAIAKELFVKKTLTVADVRRVIADQCSMIVSAPAGCFPTADCGAAEWLETEIDAVADSKDDVEAFLSHQIRRARSTLS